MGCNIHGCVEAKVWGGDWVFLCDIPNYRDYRFYARIANIRNSGEKPIIPITHPRGLPIDVTNITKVTYDIFMEETGGHDVSFLDCAELRDAVGNINPFWDAYLRFIFALGETYGEDAVRMVFWFDN